ncbi:unnamed protein product, partial [Mesorhabditis belari]|uniref:Sulfotransferase n=1 Tax=Mesorhabditis belari TaxID=2138241 RepID=A0AAF3ECH5_9BILA
MNDLETVISENSDPLPERSSNVSAEKLCLIHKNCVPMVADYETRWKTVPRFRLASCLIHKSMSTRENLNITDFEASKELCPSNSYHNFENITKMFWKLGWKYFIVTRDPIDRFLSVGFEDRHFYPQTWRCQMREHASEYKFIKYSSDPSESVIPALVEVLEQQKVPKSYIDWIKTQLVTQRTDHSTINSEARKFLEKRLHSSPYLLELLVRLFYQDYKILGYELPF